MSKSAATEISQDSPLKQRTLLLEHIYSQVNICSCA